MTDETIEVPSPFSVHHRPSKREATAATATAAAEEQMGLCGLCAAAAAAAAGGAGAGIGQGTDSLSGRQRRTSRRAAPRLRWLFRWLRISSSSKKKSSTQQLQSSPACKPPPIVSTPPHKPLASSAKEVKFQQKQASQKSKSILYPSSITSSNGGGAESSAAAVVISSADNVNNSNCKLISDDNISVHWNPTVDDQQSTFARSSGHHVLHSHHSHYTASIYSSLSGVVSELDEDENNNGEEVNSQIDDHDNNSGVAVNDDDGVSVTESVSSHDAPLLLLNSKAKSPSVKSFNPSISSSLVGKTGSGRGRERNDDGLILAFTDFRHSQHTHH